MEPAIWQRDAKKDAGSFGESVGFGQCAEHKGLNDGRMAMCPVLGILSRVQRATASGAEEPKPLPVFQPAS